MFKYFILFSVIASPLYAQSMYSLPQAEPSKPVSETYHLDSDFYVKEFTPKSASEKICVIVQTFRGVSLDCFDRTTAP